LYCGRCVDFIDSRAPFLVPDVVVKASADEYFCGVMWMLLLP